jgi:hypothetical protein
MVILSGAAVVYGLIIPEAFKSVGGHSRIAHRMLNILVSQIILNGSGIMPLRRKVIAACMTKLMRVGHKRQPGHFAYSRHDLADGPRRKGRFSL